MTHSERKSSSGFIIFILMITIGLDIMGLGLIFPIIPELVLDKANHLFLAEDTSNTIRYFYYGLVMGVWPLGMFFGSSILGRLSDLYGRKRLLIIALWGVALSYFLSAIAISIQSLGLFVFSRLTIGIFGASFGLAQATIIDVSPKERITRNLSFVTLAASIGFIFGPALTTAIGFLFVGKMQALLPCLIGGFLTLINLLSVWLYLHETRVQNKDKPKVKLNIIDMLFSFRVMFIDRRVQVLALSFLLMQAAWGFYIQDFPLVLSQIFNLSQAEIGLSFVCAALGYFGAILGLLPVLEKYYSVKTLVIVNGVLLAITLLVGVLIQVVWVEYVTFILASVFQLLFYSSLLAWFSAKVTDDEQGQIMGGTVSVFGLAWAFNAFLLGPLASLVVIFPVYIAAILFILSGFLTVKVSQQ